MNALTLYLDVHIPRAISLALQIRQVGVLTAQEDNSALLSVAELLDRATTLGMALFTFDRGWAEAMRRQRHGEAFSGLIYAHPLQISIGACIRDLEILAKAANLDEMANRILYLPL